VRPGATSSRTASTPSPLHTLTGRTGTSGAAEFSWRAIAAGLPAVSALVSTTIGRAPESHASASRRSIRASSGSGCIGSTTATASMLTARTCPEESLSAVRRISAVRRGSTASTVIRRSGHRRSTTQSPAHGSRAESPAAPSSIAPASEARTTPVASSTVQTPRSARSTRPGVESVRDSGR
jgi:hypothetical protein